MCPSKESKSDYETKADHEIVELCQIGDRLAFKILVQRYQKRVYTLLYQLAPEWKDLNDLSQEVFIRVYKGISNLRNPRIFKSWLNQIIMNLFYDELRKKPRTLKTTSIDEAIEEENWDGEFKKEIGDSSALPEELFSNNETASIIKEAMAQLPEQFRTAIVLRELQGLQYEEISEILGIALGTVKSRIWRARERLQELLRPHFPDRKLSEEEDEEDYFYG
jgi:RNA polymerase sigma-70 factor, ECF subfamily